MKTLPLLVALLVPSLAFAAEMKVVDLATNPKPESLMNAVAMKAVKQDKKAFFTDFYLDFVTKGEWVAGGAGYNKEVSAVLGAELVGVPNETYQAIVDEAFAYIQTRLGETFEIVPDADVQKTLLGFEKIAEKPSSTKQEDLGKDIPYLKVFSSKKFAPGNKVRPSPTGASGMGAYKAWFSAQTQLAATSVSWSGRVEFARVASSLGGNSKEKTATVSIKPQLFMSGGGAGFGNTKLKAGMLQNGDFAGFFDESWVKETRKKDNGVFEVVADPELYKAMALKLVKAHIDAVVAVVKSNRG